MNPILRQPAATNYCPGHLPVIDFNCGKIPVARIVADHQEGLAPEHFQKTDPSGRDVFRHQQCRRALSGLHDVRAGNVCHFCAETESLLLEFPLIREKMAAGGIKGLVLLKQFQHQHMLPVLKVLERHPQKASASGTPFQEPFPLQFRDGMPEGGLADGEAAHHVPFAGKPVSDLQGILRNRTQNFQFDLIIFQHFCHKQARPLPFFCF